MPDNVTDTQDAIFVGTVMAGVTRLKRRRRIGKALLALSLMLVGVPLQDLALGLSELLMVTLLPVSDGIAGQLLAPVNTVGALLSAVLLGLRVFYKRLFR